MRFPFSVILLVAGVVLLVFGLQAADSVASSFNRLFSGAPTDRSIWLILAGATCGLIGLASLVRRPRLAE